MSHFISECSLFSAWFGHGVFAVQSLVVKGFIGLVAWIVNMYRINIKLTLSHRKSSVCVCVLLWL